MARSLATRGGTWGKRAGANECIPELATFEGMDILFEAQITNGSDGRRFFK